MSRSAVLCGVKRMARARVMPRIKNANRTGASRLLRAGWANLRSDTGMRIARVIGFQKIKKTRNLRNHLDAVSVSADGGGNAGFCTTRVVGMGGSVFVDGVLLQKDGDESGGGDGDEGGDSACGGGSE